MAPPESASDDAVYVGRLLDGRYRIDALLGSGGMGRVYRAEHTGIGRAVAIKVLHADLGRNREAATRFQREALASGRLDHANIVGVSDFGVLDEGGCYLVMEALDGESLGARLERDGQLAWRDALAILRSVLAGLRHAHDRGVVHRDIKPDNIFLARKDDELVVKILDFGIAKLYAGSGEDPATTRAGLTIGTPAYLSPEQAVGGDITPASDLYSATIVLFEMLTGQAPFDGNEPIAMLTAHVTKPPPALHAVAPAIELPAGLEELVQRGLAKLPTDRIGSAAEYIAALDEVEGIPPSPLRRSQPVLAQPSPADHAWALTPSPVVHTPLAFAPTSVHAHTPVPVDRAATPDPARAVSLAELGPVPRRHLYIGGIVLGSAVLLAIVITLASGGSPAPPTAPPARSVAVKADKPAASPAPIVAVKPPVAPIDAAAPIPATTVAPPPVVDRSPELTAAIAELEHGKTCKDRDAAIKKLVELGDPKAIVPLKKARHWWHDRYLGLSHDDWNSCLTKDADAAIAKLTPT